MNFLPRVFSEHGARSLLVGHFPLIDLPGRPSFVLKDHFYSHKAQWKVDLPYFTDEKLKPELK